MDEILKVAQRFETKLESKANEVEAESAVQALEQLVGRHKHSAASLLSDLQDFPELREQVVHLWNQQLEVMMSIRDQLAELDDKITEVVAQAY